MFAPLSLFFISALGMVFLIVHKRLEIIHGKGLIVRDLWHGLDHKVHVALQKSRGWLAATNAKNFFRGLHILFTHIVHGLLAGINWIQVRLHHLAMRLRHEKRTMDATTSASVYLKQVSDAKNKEQKIKE